MIDCIYCAGGKCSRELTDRQKDFVAGAEFVLDQIEVGKSALFAPAEGELGEVVSGLQKKAADDLRDWLCGAVAEYIGCRGGADGKEEKQKD